MEHISVLLNEAVDGLEIRPDGVYVDATLGRGGHSRKIAEKLTSGRLIAFDLDEQAIEETKLLLADLMEKITIVHANFADMKQELLKLGIEKVDGILMDLGVSSPQFDDPARGFSYRYDARLDMRMDQTKELSAYEVINNYRFDQLMKIFSHYGEEPFAKNIARKIEAARVKAPIETTLQLVDVIRSALPAKVLSKKGHPAKQVFQAIRIEVNGELDSLKQALSDGITLLNDRGTFCVITFHSLEDRMVKEMFKEVSTVYVPKKLPIAQLPQANYEVTTRKPIIADESELSENQRSHSAKLRILRKTGGK